MTRTLLLAIAVVLAPVESWADATQSATATAAGEWTADTRQSWSANGERRIQLNLRAESGHNWGSGVPVSELENLPEAALDGMVDSVQFSWTREAGVFRFQGSFDRGRGAGTFTFSVQPAYVSGMATLGYRNLAGDDLLRLAVLDVTQAFVRGVRDVGFEAMPLDDLVRFRIHKVTTEFIRGLSERNYRGLRAGDLVKMKIHKVSVEEIDELKALGYSGLDPDELVKLRIHKVTPQFIRSIHEVGYRTITIEQLVRMRIHRIDAQFIEHLQADGYQNLTVADVIDFAIRGPRVRRTGRPF